MNEHIPPLIVTLKLDAGSFERLDSLRRTHFPPARNFLSAHITLFHALPGSEQSSVEAVLNAISADVVPLPLDLPGVRMLGRGVAVEVRSERLAKLRADMAKRFDPWLTPQDRQGFRPHVTIQNKVAPHAARALHDALNGSWVPGTAVGEGLVLWQYLGGPWRKTAEFLFSGLSASAG